MQTEYRFSVRPLSEEEGGGYLIEYPDLPGCMSDGETVEEAITNGEEAKRDWLAAMREIGRRVGGEAYSGKWQVRVPRSLHQRMAERARDEGVSLNALTIAFLSEGLGHRKEAHD